MPWQSRTKGQGRGRRESERISQKTAHFRINSMTLYAALVAWEFFESLCTSLLRLLFPALVRDGSAHLSFLFCFSTVSLLELGSYNHGQFITSALEGWYEEGTGRKAAPPGICMYIYIYTYLANRKSTTSQKVHPPELVYP